MDGHRRRHVSPVSRRSEPVHRFMVSYFERFFRRHMNGLHIAEWGLPPALTRGKIIVYSNHSAWWDAALYIMASRRFFPQHETYAPIDARMLAQYGFLSRMGAFGVDPDTRRGASQFLAQSANVLAADKRAIWITAQGTFRDARERPLRLKAGVGRLIELAPDATVLPLAIEYSFWLERGAEAFLAFGDPMPGKDLLELPRGARLARLEQSLTGTLDRLNADVQARDPAKFGAVLMGHSGIGGIYDGWRRLSAFMRGRPFDASHEGRGS
jgi:1-acyl-sn-glycerol-3-phosphate acyltransferase